MSRPTISYPTPVPGQSGRSGSQEAYANPRQVSSSSTSSRSAPTIIDSSITRLLVLTKQMLQSMEQWSQGQITEEDVSDIYVKLGNGFEQCVDAFRKSGLSTKELDSIPADLRVCLEQALSEEPSQETLNVYLPNIRTIIFALLNGLKQKQVAYKRLLSDRQEQQQMHAQIQQQQQRVLDPVEEANAKLTGRSVSPSGHQQPQPGNTLPRVPSSHMLSQRNVSGQPSRPAPPDAFRPSRMRPPEGPRERRTSATSSHRDVTPRRSSASCSGSGTGTPPAAPAPSGTPPADGLVRHQLTDAPVIDEQRSGSGSSSGSAPIPVPTILAPAQPVKPTPPRPDRFSRDSFGNPRPVSRFSADSEITNGSPIRSPPQHTPPKTRRISTLPEDDAEDAMADADPPASQLSSSASSSRMAPLLPVLNLPSDSLSMPDATDPKTPPPLATERIPDVPLETRSTLAALSRQDPLERRASRRFSSYNFSKMLPGSPSSKKLSSPQRPTRRAAAVPPMPSLRESLGGASVDSPVVPISSSSLRIHLDASGSGGSDDARLPPPRTPSPQLDPDTSMRIVPTPDLTPTPSAPTPLPAAVSIFLQIGRQVKKTNVELPTNLSSIKLLFMERFEYDPGKEDFPEVYIRDHKTGVQFELEDMDDLREGIVLSLNIEPLDQVKQHFDLTVAALMQEIKEMKSSLDHTRRMSTMTPSPAAMMSLSPSMNMANPAKMPRPEPLRLSPTISPSDSKTSLPTALATGPRRDELQAQHDEVTSLRRDLAVMRQVHVDFLAETKESFAKLRTQNSAMRDVVKTKMTGSRALLDNSKAKLETQCQEAIQAVEEISDIIDAAREDAYKRFVTPSAKQVSNIKQSLEKATNFVDQFSRDVTLADPTWRSTWASELKRVQEEQGLLSHQRKLAADLRNDIKDASDMFGAVQDFVVQRASGTRVGSKGFRPPSPDETNGSGGMPNLLMEIRTKEADPHQRLRAIEAQRKAREKELSERTDEFTSELGDFVKGRKLKKTGGHEEVERVRARRNDNTLKKMLTGDNPPNGSGGDLSASTNSTGGATALTPQFTGVSMLSAQLTGTSMKSTVLSPQMTGSSVMSPKFTDAGSSGHRLSGSSIGGGGGAGTSGFGGESSLGAADAVSSERRDSDG